MPRSEQASWSDGSPPSALRDRDCAPGPRHPPCSMGRTPGLASSFQRNRRRVWPVLERAFRRPAKHPRHDHSRTAPQPGRRADPDHRPEGRADPEVAGGGGLLCRGAARADQPRPAVPARRHLCGQRLYGHHAARPRTSTSSARPATTRASSAISRSSATPSRSRTSAGSARSSRASISSTSSSPPRTAPCRSATPGSRTRARSRCSAAPVRIVGPTELDLVERLHPAAPPLRRRRRHARHAQAARPDRLAAPARLHGAALGGAAGAPHQFPLDLSDRARPHPALADGRAAGAAAEAARSCRRRR